MRGSDDDKIKKNTEKGYKVREKAHSKKNRVRGLKRGEQ